MMAHLLVVCYQTLIGIYLHIRPIAVQRLVPVVNSQVGPSLQGQQVGIELDRRLLRLQIHGLHKMFFGTHEKALFNVNTGQIGVDGSFHVVVDTV